MYGGEHTVMKRVIKDGPRPFIADLMQRRSSSMMKIAVARTTIDKDRGEDAPSTAEASLERQFGAQAALDGQRSDVRKLELRGVSVVHQSGADHPLTAVFQAHGCGVICTVTSVNRASRHVGTLQYLRGLVEQNGGNLFFCSRRGRRSRLLRA